MLVERYFNPEGMVAKTVFELDAKAVARDAGHVFATVRIRY